MIRYSITLDNLNQQADGISGTWLARAAALTAKFETAGKYLDSEAPIWSEIKDIFISLQQRKCAFCERKLEAKKEYDVEHFRPKGSVKRWKVAPELTAAGVVVNQPATANPKEAGYHRLAYHLLNYSVACAQCNSVLKSDYFPIKGTRQPGSDNPVPLLVGEQPFLLFPIGDWDDDPEEIISFHGLSPQAKARKGTHKHHRGLLTIDFFNLDNADKRVELFRGRADVIKAMWLAFFLLGDDRTTAEKREKYQKIFDYHQSERAPHTSCGRSYGRLCLADPAKAEEIFNGAVDFLESRS